MKEHWKVNKHEEKTDRKKKTIVATGRLIVRSILGAPGRGRKSNKQIASDLAVAGIVISPRTARRSSLEHDYTSRLAKRKPFLRAVKG